MAKQVCKIFHSISVIWKTVEAFLQTNQPVIWWLVYNPFKKIFWGINNMIITEELWTLYLIPVTQKYTTHITNTPSYLHQCNVHRTTRMEAMMNEGRQLYQTHYKMSSRKVNPVKLLLLKWVWKKKWWITFLHRYLCIIW